MIAFPAAQICQNLHKIVSSRVIAFPATQICPNLHKIASSSIRALALVQIRPNWHKIIKLFSNTQLCPQVHLKWPNSQMMFNMLTWYWSDQTLSKTSCGSLVSWSRSEEEKSRHVWLIRSKESFFISPKCALVCRLTNNLYYIYHNSLHLPQKRSRRQRQGPSFA